MSTIPRVPLDLSTPQRLHVVGVGGPGMSAIAIVLAEMGHTVSRSDIRERPVLERVRAAGVEVHVGHNRRLVDGCVAVTASTAVPAKNIELDEAARSGIAVLSRAGMLSSICAQAKSLGAVAPDVTNVPHFVQNFVPGRSSCPQLLHCIVFSLR